LGKVLEFKKTPTTIRVDSSGPNQANTPKVEVDPLVKGLSKQFDRDAILRELEAEDEE
jgi:hypothetical protein